MVNSSRNAIYANWSLSGLDLPTGYKSVTGPRRPDCSCYEPFCRCLRAEAGQSVRWLLLCNSAGLKTPRARRPWGTSAQGRCQCQRNTRRRTGDPLSAPAPLQTTTYNDNTDPQPTEFNGFDRTSSPPPSARTKKHCIQITKNVTTRCDFWAWNG